jgi:hypothetical protein
MLGLALGTSGCFNPWKPLVAGRGVPEPQPVPDTPQGVLRLFEWCYEQREPTVYRELFTDDYRFLFSAADSAGNPYRDRPFTREDELASTTRLFEEAVDIRLVFDVNFNVLPDYREGKRDSVEFYKSIRTTVNLTIRGEDGGSTEVRGHALFFVCRGDVALIPDELVQRGFGPDPKRWYINRWEDETAGEGAPLAALRPRGSISAPSLRVAENSSPVPSAQQGILTWGWLKAYYGVLETPGP